MDRALRARGFQWFILAVLVVFAADGVRRGAWFSVAIFAVLALVLAAALISSRGDE